MTADIRKRADLIMYWKNVDYNSEISKIITGYFERPPTKEEFALISTGDHVHLDQNCESYGINEAALKRNTREQQNAKKSAARRKGGRTESQVPVTTTIDRAAFTAISTTQLSITSTGSSAFTEP